MPDKQCMSLDRRVLKPLFCCLMVLLPVSGCDSPRYQDRFPGGIYTLVPGEDYGEDDDSPAFERDIPEEISHCRWDEYAYSSSHLGGEYALCQSKDSELEVFVKIQNPESDDADNPLEVCFFPTHTSGDKTILLGKRRCLRIVSETIYKIVFSKFSGEDVTGLNSIMAIKNKSYRYDRPYSYYGDKGPDAFEKCMDELSLGNDKYCQSFHKLNEYLIHTF